MKTTATLGGPLSAAAAWLQLCPTLPDTTLFELARVSPGGRDRAGRGQRRFSLATRQSAPPAALGQDQHTVMPC